MARLREVRQQREPELGARLPPRAHRHKEDENDESDHKRRAEHIGSHLASFSSLYAEGNLPWAPPQTGTRRRRATGAAWDRTVGEIQAPGPPETVNGEPRRAYAARGRTRENSHGGPHVRNRARLGLSAPRVTRQDAPSCEFSRGVAGLCALTLSSVASRRAEGDGVSHDLWASAALNWRRGLWRLALAVWIIGAALIVANLINEEDVEWRWSPFQRVCVSDESRNYGECVYNSGIFSGEVDHSRTVRRFETERYRASTTTLVLYEVRWVVHSSCGGT